MSYRFTHSVRSLPVNLLHLENRSHGSFELLSLGLPTTLLELWLSAILRQMSILFAYAVLSARSTLRPRGPPAFAVSRLSFCLSRHTGQSSFVLRYPDYVVDAFPTDCDKRCLSMSTSQLQRTARQMHLAY